MKINTLDTKEILDFENDIPVELIVNERPKHYNLPKYYVSFKNAEISECKMLKSTHGNGETIDDALRDYCNKIESKRMVLFAYTEKRMEIVCPKLVHTKLLSK